MVSISINRQKYRANKASATWLDKFFEAQVKEAGTVTRMIKDKEVISNVHTIVAWKLFQLAEKNGFTFPNIRTQVEEGKVGAIGRARMILAGCLKRKIGRGEEIFDVEGNPVPADDAFLAYRASIGTPKPDAPAVSGETDEGPVAA